MNDNTVDVAIVGGGLAGLTLALQLKQKRPETSIAVFESRKHPVPEAAHKVGESTVEVGAHYFSRVLGLQDHLKDRQLPKLGLRYFFSHGDNSDIAERVELGGNVYLPTPSYQIDRGRFENFLGEEVVKHDVLFMTGMPMNSLTLDHEAGHTVTVRSGKKSEMTWAARWVIDATGRAETVKSMLDLKQKIQHQGNSAWFRIADKVRIDDWSDHAGWKEQGGGESSRWLSTNHLMGPGYWVWLIPLASGSTSIGLVADPALHPFEEYDDLDKLWKWFDRHEPQCAERLRPYRDRIQDFYAIEKYSYSATKVFSSERWCLTGEAGVFIDPFYSPGSDFIGLANTFITELVTSELMGENVSMKARWFNDVFFLFFKNNLALYEQQYPLFGNALVMSYKIIWDFSYYWAIPAYVFFKDRLCDLEMYGKCRGLFERAGDVNRSMQDQLRSWSGQNGRHLKPGFVDLPGIPFMRDLNSNLRDHGAAVDIQEQLTRHVSFLEKLAACIEGRMKSDDRDLSTDELIPTDEGSRLSECLRA